MLSEDRVHTRTTVNIVLLTNYKANRIPTVSLAYVSIQYMSEYVLSTIKYHVLSDLISSNIKFYEATYADLSLRNNY